MERVRVKMCGLTRPEDVAEAVRLGADFLGFIFAPGSRRLLQPDAAEALLAGVETGPARRVGVFCDQPAPFVNAMVERCRLDLVQLHGHEPRDYAAALDVPVLRVLRLPVQGSGVQEKVAANEASGAAAALLEPNVFAALVDAEDAHGRSGGLGRQVDAASLERLLAELPPSTRLFISGGLTAENVAAIVLRYHPYAVDVASGIETAPGIKDAARMAAFMAAVATESERGG